MPSPAGRISPALFWSFSSKAIWSCEIARRKSNRYWALNPISISGPLYSLDTLSSLSPVSTLEVGDLRGVAGFHQRLETSADEFGGAAAEHCLFAEEVAFGLFAEVGVDHAGLEAAQRQRVGQSAFQGLSGGVLVNGDQGGNADAFGVEFADAV